MEGRVRLNEGREIRGSDGKLGRGSRVNDRNEERRSRGNERECGGSETT